MPCLLSFYQTIDGRDIVRERICDALAESN
jgi:hypothetical protein